MAMATVKGEHGLVYLNGRLCGETGTVTMPLAPDGTHYLEMRPFGMGTHALATRLVLSQDRLMEDPADGVYAVMWPGAWLSLEITPVEEPEPLPDAPAQLLSTLQIGEEPYYLVAEAGVLTFGVSPDTAVFVPVALPERATLTALPDGVNCAAVGTGVAGPFVAILRLGDTPSVIELRQGAGVSLRPDGAIVCLDLAGDIAGHATETVIAPDGQGGYTLSSQQAVFEMGIARKPHSAADTARAFLEALQLGILPEAAAYCEQPAQAVLFAEPIGLVDAVVPLPADGQEGIAWGVLRLDGQCRATVRKVQFVMVVQGEDFKVRSVTVED